MKFVLYGAAAIVTAPLWSAEIMSRRVSGRDVWFVTQSEILSLIPGRVGRMLRNAYYYRTLKSCPLHVCLQFGCLFAYSGVSVGHNVYLGLHSKVGLVDIGDRTIISDDVQLLSGAHQHVTTGSGYVGDSPHSRQIDLSSDVKPEKITIGRNCWIGTRAIVMADVGDNCIIGAGAVVTRPIPPNSVALGMPARVVRQLIATETKFDKPSNEIRQELTSAR
jgi:acetyltransferase-like isoleucine patch superfamily enzyme